MDMELAKEAAQEHTMTPEASMINIAKCVKKKVMIVYFSVLSYQNMSPENLEPKLFQEKYVNSVSLLLETSQIVFILSQETTMTGCVSRVIPASYSVSARIVRNIKLRKIG